jgi:hypothetical protein
MSEPEKQVQNLIRLKRFEEPRDGYFEDFLEEFRSRRNEAETSRVFLNSRVSGGAGNRKWFIGAGMAYAALLTVVLMWPNGPETKQDASRQPIIFEPKQPVRNSVTPPKTPISIPRP